VVLPHLFCVFLGVIFGTGVKGGVKKWG